MDAQNLKLSLHSTLADVAAVGRGAVEDYRDHDRQFHDLIASGAHNPILASKPSSLANRVHIVRRMDLDPVQGAISGQQHLEIAAALQSRDGQRASRLNQGHIQKHWHRVALLIDEGKAAID